MCGVFCLTYGVSHSSLNWAPSLNRGPLETAPGYTSHTF
jgi:hypothetical protein